MKEFDINDAWKNSDKQAEEYYSQIKSEVMELAQKKSESILDKLKRTIIWEWVATFITFLVVLILFRESPNFWIGVISCAVLLAVTAIPYYKLWIDLKNTPTQNMVTCLQSYIKILDGFIQKVKLLFWLMLPIGFFIGLYLHMEPGATFDISKIEWGKLAITVVFAAVFIALVLWSSIKFYMPKLYGNPKREFQEILKSLKEE